MNHLKKKNEKEVANMCFMAIDDLDEVNSNSSDEGMHVIFEELYEDFESIIEMFYRFMVIVNGL